MAAKSPNISRDSQNPGPAVPRAWLVALTTLLIVPWLIAGVLYLKPWARAAGGAESPMTSADQVPEGPWGRLTLMPIVISPPLELVSADWGPVQPPVWVFPGTGADGVEQFLVAAGVPGPDAARVRSTARLEPRITGVVVMPDPAWVTSLSPEVRARIYAALGKTGMNVDQAQAFRYRGTSVEAWLGQSRASKKTLGLVAPLVYRVGDYMLFADIERVRAEIGDAEELRRLAKGLLRQPTVLVHLSVTDPASVSALADYWGRGGRRTDVRPLLESVAGSGVEGSIDLVHLLPAFVRNHLYRYPRLSAADFDRPIIANCLWSSLNFFAVEPDDRYLDVQTALETLKRDYFVVESQFELGDVVAFLDEDGTLFHAAVYLADDLVFSKNGTSPMAPWIIMSIDDVKGYYQTRAENPRLIFHRRTDF